MAVWGTRRSQEPDGTRMNQEHPGARMSMHEPAGQEQPWRSKGEPGRARRRPPGQLILTMARGSCEARRRSQEEQKP